MSPAITLTETTEKSVFTQYQFILNWFVEWKSLNFFQNLFKLVLCQWSHFVKMSPLHLHETIGFNSATFRKLLSKFSMEKIKLGGEKTWEIKLDHWIPELLSLWLYREETVKSVAIFLLFPEKVNLSKWYFDFMALNKYFVMETKTCWIGMFWGGNDWRFLMFSIINFETSLVKS